jgi:hypothetical protein
MPRHDPGVRLRHMLDAAREGVQMAQGKTRTGLDANRPLNLSLVRLLEIVGEAASGVPADERAKYPDIPWAQSTPNALCAPEGRPGVSPHPVGWLRRLLADPRRRLAASRPSGSSMMRASA